MNELLGYLGMLRNIGWVYLAVLFAVATGLFVFDRGAKQPANREEETIPDRRAA
jgi:hypothetical protein